MILSKSLLKIAFALTLFVFFTSCTDRKEERIEIDPAFGKYISGFSSGVLSVNSNIVIRMVDAVAGSSEVGQPLPENILTFTPEIDGVAIWKNQNTIEFVPSVKLPPGEIYRAEFALGTLVDVDKGFETFIFQFQTMFQDLSVSRVGIESKSDDLTVLDFVAMIHTSDIMDVDDIHRSTRAKLNGKEYAFTLTPSENLSIILRVLDLPRTEEAGNLTIAIDPGLLKLNEAKEFSFGIPALGEFELLEAGVSPDSPESVILEFSDPLSTQDLHGRITLEGVDDLRFVQRKNIVEIHTSETLEGTKLITVYPSLTNVADKPFGNTYTTAVHFMSRKPEVTIPQGKNILPNRRDGLIFAFDAVSLNAVDIYVSKIFSNNILQYFQDNNLGGDYQMRKLGRNIYRKHLDLTRVGSHDLRRWNRFYVDLAEILDPDKGAFYQVEIRFRQSYSAFPCEGAPDETLKPSLTTFVRDGWITDGTYYDDDYYRDFIYDWRNMDDPCHSAYYTPSMSSASKIVMSTNMGIMAKMGQNNQLQVVVNDINTATPMPGIEIEVFDYQQQVIAKGTTDVHGMITLACNRSPFVVSAASPGDKTYLKVQGGNALSVSKFEVDGASVKGGVKGFIYGDRGVWRPGDSLYLNFIMEDKSQILPDGHPVEMKIFDPRDRVITTMVRTQPTGTFYDFRTSTDAEAPTGRYRAEVSVGNRTYYKNLNIETIKPNRLKVEVEFDQSPATGDAISGRLKSAWLHGSPAPHLEADISMGLRASNTTFDGFEAFEFDNTFLDHGGYAVAEVFEGKLDARGEANFSVNMSDKTKGAPGMMTAYFEAKVYEPGGGFSIHNQTLVYSPFERYAGISIPEGGQWGGSLETGQNHVFSVVSLHPDGKPTKTQNLQVDLYKIDWRWWYDRYNGTSLNYLNNSSVRKVKSQTVNLKDGRGTWSVNISDGNWGRYLAVITDPVSGHSAADFAYFDWPYERRAQRGGSASTILELYADKNAYSIGETSKISFLTPANGRALISIENGTEVLKSRWINTQAGNTDIEIPIEEGMSPNVYVHITLLQPHSQTTNDRPMRMYGIHPLKISDPATFLKPGIQAPEVLRPGESFTVEVSEENGKAMTYTLALVDDGLLDLTGFKTPDPHSHFYAPEALGVSTWDYYDEIFGALDVGRAEVMRIGGDESGIDASKQKARRFDPVVRFIGPVQIGKGETSKHQITMPNYIGSVRLMVVAGQGPAYGNAEKTLPVRSPLMVLATMPRVVGPGEEISLPVNVFATESNVKSANIRVETNDAFALPDGGTQRVNFDGESNKTVYFRLKTKEKPGKGQVSVQAKSGSHSSRTDVEIDVRPPNPRYTKVQSRALDPGETWTGKIEYFGLDGSNEAKIELSDFAPINLEAKMNYLIHYPHGCLEQIVSGAFPQLVLDRLTKLTAERKAETESNVRFTLNRLRSYQTSSGGLSYWPGTARIDPWSTSYAGHFALAAEKAGYQLPAGFKSQWLTNQRLAARNWLSQPDNDRAWAHRDQAYRLYTIALAGNAELAGMNHLSNVANLDLTARYILALAYAQAGLDDAAKNLIANQNRHIPEYTELSYTFGSHVRDDGFVLLALHALDFKEDAAEVAQRIAENIGSSNHLGTQTTAVSLLALADYLGGNHPGGIQATFTSGGQTQNVATAMPLVQLQPSSSGRGEEFTVTNHSDTPLFARLIVSGQPLAGMEETGANNLRMTVKYLNNDFNPIDVSNLAVGSDFVAEVTVTNPGTRGDYKNLALTQIFPSGWEILNPRMGGPEVETHISPEYQDIRDDRVLSYFDLGAQDQITLRIRLNAAYPGKFYLPATSCTAMYDERISAVKKGHWVEVR